MASPDSTHDRQGLAVAVSAVLLVCALAASLAGVIGYVWLTGDPVSEEGDLCVGGGHPVHGVAMLAVGGAALAGGLASLVQSLNRRRSWPFMALTVALLAGAALLLAYLPDASELDVGQC